MAGVVEVFQQLNNTLYEIHTGIPNGIYKEIGADKKPTPPESRTKDISVRNTADLLSTVITGKKVNELVLGKTGGDSGEYDTSINGRLQKTTELITGIITGIFAEDQIRSKLGGLDMTDKKSVESTLGSMHEKASFLKNSMHAQDRISKAIEALVLSYVYGDLKADVRMAELSRKPYPENVSEPFWTELKEAYTKVAGDFTNNIRNNDISDIDDHKYPMYPNSDKKI